MFIASMMAHNSSLVTNSIAILHDTWAHLGMNSLTLLLPSFSHDASYISLEANIHLSHVEGGGFGIWHHIQVLIILDVELVVVIS